LLDTGASLHAGKLTVSMWWQETPSCASQWKCADGNSIQ
jgi:hypothetical protein